MAKIPRPSGFKDETPDAVLKTPSVPAQSALVSAQLDEVPKLKITPEQTAPIETVPEASPEKEEVKRKSNLNQLN